MLAGGQRDADPTGFACRFARMSNPMCFGVWLRGRATPARIKGPPSLTWTESELRREVRVASCHHSSVAQWQSIRLLTGGLLVRVQPEEPNSDSGVWHLRPVLRGSAAPHCARRQRFRVQPPPLKLRRPRPEEPNFTGPFR